jgi:uncharacterized protein with PIN domain
MDISLYRFAKQLRLFGCDVVCDPTVRFAQVLVLARKEGRIVLATPGRLVPQLERLARLIRAVDAETEAENAGAAAAALHARRRRLVGYNSDGESEYEEDTTDVALIAATSVPSPAVAAPPHPLTTDRVINSSAKEHDAVMAAASLSITAPQPFRYIVVDCHGDFKAELRRVIVETGVTWDANAIFTRCVKCNAELRQVAHKTDVEGRVTPGIYRVYHQFYECPLCLKVFWGVNEGTVVNFKSARTAEFLRSVMGSAAPAEGCDVAAAAAQSGTLTIRRHLFSLPRRVKVCIFSFLTDPELDTFVVAAPLFRELSTMFRKGLVLKFVPEWKRNGRRNPKWEAHEAEQNRRLAEYDAKQRQNGQQ